VARRPNYGFEKRQKEIKRQEKAAEKAERKRLRKEDEENPDALAQPDGDDGGASVGPDTAAAAPSPGATAVTLRAREVVSGLDRPLFEQYLLRSLRVGQGDLTVLFSSTLGNVLWLFVIATLVLPWLRSRRKSGVLARSAAAGYET